MKTKEQIEALLALVEECVEKGHPYYTANTPRKELTELVQLVRDQERELGQLREKALQSCLMM